MHCGMSVLSGSQFISYKYDCQQQQKRGKGYTVEFLANYIHQFSNDAIGLDISDVNLNINPEENDEYRLMDTETFRDLFEGIVNSVQGANQNAGESTEFAQ